MILPEDRAPDDYQRVQANPAEMGGLIAQGAEKFGQGATLAGERWGQIQTDDASNNYQKESSQLVEKFRALQGQDALNAQQPTYDQLDKLYQTYRTQLSTPEQQRQFDNANRPFTERYLRGQITTHGVQQGQEFGLQTANDAIQVAHSMAATAGSDGSEATAAVARAKALDAGMKQLQLRGQENDPDAKQRVIDNAGLVYKSYAEALAVKDPLAAQRFIEAHKREMGSNYAPVAEQMRLRADKAIGDQANADASHHVANNPPAQTQQAAVTDPAAMLRHFEGFRTNAYWDVNHWRTGYGSDTITLPDGTVQPVTATTTVTREDAERDLTRRVQQSQSQLQAVAGDAWGRIAPEAKASLTSVVYNYGRVPDVLINPIKSGDSGQIAAGIRTLAAFSNSGRRQQEAANVAGKFSLGGPTGATSPQPTMQANYESGGNVVQFPQQAATGEQPPAPEQAAFTPTPQEQTAVPPETPESFLARKIQYIEQRQDLTDDQKAYAVKSAETEFKVAQIAAEQTAAAKKAQKDAVMEEYAGYAVKGDFAGAYAHLQNDGRLSNEERLTIGDMLEKRSGNPNPVTFGTHYNEYLKRVIADARDPQRIGDPIDIYRAEADGQITSKGADELVRVMGQVKKSTSEFSEARIVSSGLDELKRRMTFEDDTGFVKIRDPKGQELLPEATATFIGQLDTWKAEGKPVSQFPLFQRDKLAQFVDAIRPRRQMELDRLNAQADVSGELPSGSPSPPPPQGVDPAPWGQVMASRPAGRNGPVPTMKWANDVARLAADPQRMAPLWDSSQFGRAGIRARAILDQLGVKYDATPGKPENVGNEPPPLLRPAQQAPLGAAETTGMP